MSGRIEISRIGTSVEQAHEDNSELRRNLYDGLTSVPKDISPWPKYLYDARGSELFEEITKQPEYYQTRTELSILKSLSWRMSPGERFSELVELGSGSASKTRALIDPMISSGESVRYISFDVSESALKESAYGLLEDYPSLEVLGYVGDFDGAVGDFLCELPERYGARLVIFLGGTIGNFSAYKRIDFLKGVRRGMSSGDRFLVGIDLVRSRSTLEAAYNDAAGVTAAFNKNVLNVLNRLIGSDFDLGLFFHRAIFNSEHNRIEMWLDSVRDQEILVPDPGSTLSFSSGEGLRTEVSHKFTRESARSMFEGSGMRMLDLYTDEEELFGLALAEPE